MTRGVWWRRALSPSPHKRWVLARAALSPILLKTGIIDLICKVGVTTFTLNEYYLQKIEALQMKIVFVISKTTLIATACKIPHYSGVRVMRYQRYSKSLLVITIISAVYCTYVCESGCGLGANGPGQGRVVVKWARFSCWTARLYRSPRYWRPVSVTDGCLSPCLRVSASAVGEVGVLLGSRPGAHQPPPRALHWLRARPGRRAHRHLAR